MILNTLSLQAFGPFKKRFTIDFEKLNDSGIFLLTGETGVGKTSIFDAITFALYGDICGSNQDLEKVRSDYASENEITFVELTFEINNKLYTIRREPQQSVVGKGGKVVTRPHFVLLKYDDKNLMGPKEVSKAITELLGLTINQFRQIVMIPQGEFMKLLTSSSEEKVKIFRQIFKTENLVRLEDLIKDKSKELYSEVSEVKISIDSKISSLVNVDKDLNYDIKIEKIKEAINSYKQTRNTIQEEFDSLNKLCEEFKQKLNEKELKNKKIDEYILCKNDYKELLLHKDEIEFKKDKIEKSIKAYKVKGVYDKIEIINNEIKSLEEKINECNRIIDESNAKLKENDKIFHELAEREFEYKQNQSDLIKNKNEFNRLDEYNKINNQLEEYSISISAKKKRMSELEMIEENLQDKLITFDESLKEMNEVIFNEANYTSKKLVLESQIEKYNMYKKYTIELEGINKKIEECTELITNLLKEEYDIDEEILNVKRRLLDDKAYVLAMDLEEGKPCPVCGSIRHPKRALPSDIDVNDGMIIELEAKKAEAKEKANSAVLDNKSFFSEKTHIEALMDSLNINYNDSDYNNYLSELDDAKKMLEEIEVLKSKRDTTLENKLETDNNYAELKNEQNKLILELSEADKQIGVLSARVDLLNVDETIDYEIIIKELESKIDKYEKDVEDNKNEKLECKSAITSAFSNISIYNDNLVSKDRELKVCTNELEKLGVFENYKDYLLEEELIERYNNSINEFNNKQSYFNEYFNRNSNLEGQAKEDLEKLVEIVKENEENKTRKTAELTEARLLVERYEKELSIIEALKNQSNKKIELYERLQRLSKIANGDNRLKMSFEKYVLAIYFEDVINYANEILKRLTDRYILVRRDTLAKGNAQQGLDIDVYDFDTSARRSVKTLSGGETFKASLSLALGLSEMIKQRKSLIDINTMFIDEGFGTLDSESLDSAINMLCGLKEQGQKIGIISHVSELKQRINSKIIVSRTNEGSSVRVVGE